MAPKKRSTKARGRGRPKSEPGTEKVSRVTIRFTEAERAAIDAQAERAGVPVAEWARGVLVRAAKAKR